jgi:hypothetical protein
LVHLSLDLANRILFTLAAPRSTRLAAADPLDPPVAIGGETGEVPAVIRLDLP